MRNTGGPLLIIRRDGEPLERLDPDPRRIIDGGVPRHWMIAILAATIVLTVATIAYGGWTGGIVGAGRPHPIVDNGMGPGFVLASVVPVGALTVLGWAFLIIENLGVGKRRELRDRYRALCAASPTPQFATVVECTFRSGDTTYASHCVVTARLPDGRVLRAAELSRRPARTSDRRESRYTTLQVPQYGDTCAVFESPEVPGFTIVQANRSWSALHGR